MQKQAYKFFKIVYCKNKAKNYTKRYEYFSNYYTKPYECLEK